MEEDLSSSDMEANAALRILQEQATIGKLSQEELTHFKTLFESLHNSILISFKNQKDLPSKAKLIQEELQQKRDEFEQAQANCDESEVLLHNAQNAYRQAELNEENEKKSVEQLTIEYEQLEADLIDQEMRTADEEKLVRLKIKPEEDALNEQLEKINNDMQQKITELDKERKFSNEASEKLAQLRQTNENQFNIMVRLEGEVLQIKDEPARFAKKIDMLIQAKTSMINDLDAINEDIAKKQRQTQDLAGKFAKREGRLKEVLDEISTFEGQAEIIAEKAQRLDAVKQTLLLRSSNLQEEKAQWDDRLAMVTQENRDIDQDINYHKKKLRAIKAANHKQERAIKQCQDEIITSQMQTEKMAKEEQALAQKCKDVQIEIGQQDASYQITEIKKRLLEDKSVSKDDEKKRIQAQIVDLEKQLSVVQQFESKSINEIKIKTKLRESMARKVSTAVAEVRVKDEELKTKQLLTLDLSKKHADTTSRLNHFKQLYDEVKAARNKYVNLIQSLSQDLAELKERIKILQNELEILKNECQEKDQALLQYQHIIKLDLQKRDRNNTKLNKADFLRKKKRDVIDQNIHEIEKFSKVISNLEKELLDLRKNYEEACEGRNLTGIQLIDRNDELCLLYEKQAIHDDVIKNGNMELMKLDDEIRMIKIELHEKRRQIEIAHKQIGMVPKLAAEVIQLKQELENIQKQIQTVSEQLENPNNEERWKELPSEDIDRDKIQAKIQTLEDRLNSKKEELLEKDLVLDEITNLSDQLKKQAVGGRQDSLKIAEKLSSFSYRIKQLTRQIMATVAELSMLQAMGIKLSSERDDLARQVGLAIERFEAGKAPTIEMEIEYLKRLRDQKMFTEAKRVQQLEKQFAAQFAPFATKTTAKKRFGEYTLDELTIPQAYGANTPFQPSTQGANMRHYKKPAKR